MTPPASATKLCASSGRYDLEFFHCFERDVDRCSLTTKLLAEEAVVVVATIEAYVVEDAALSGEGDLIAIRSLNNAYSWGKSQQVFKLATQNRSEVLTANSPIVVL